MAVKIAGKEVKAVHAATGGTWLALVGIAGEALRQYSNANAKVGAVKGIALEKASDAGALRSALDQCMEIVARCAQ